MADLMADLDAALAEDPELHPAASIRTAPPPKTAPKLVNQTPPAYRPAPAQRRPGVAEDYGLRGVVGGVADAAFGLLDTAGTLDKSVWAGLDRGLHSALGVHLPGGYSVVDGKAVPVNASEALDAYKHNRDQARQALKTVAPEPVRGGAKITRDISEFAANFIPLMKASEGVQALGSAARWSRPLIASGIAAYQKTDPMEGNLANVAESLGVKKSAVAKMLHVDDLADALSVDASDSEFAARLKNMAADGVAGLATEGAFKALGQMAKVVRSAKVEKAELDALAKAADAKPEVNTQAIREALDEQAAADAAPTLAAKADPAPSLVKDEAPALAADVPAGTQGELFGNTRSAAPDALDEFERVHLDVDAKVKGMSADELRQLADDQAAGRGFQMLERMGVNPARLDFGKFLAEHSDPAEAMTALHDWVARIATAAEPMSLQLGSKPRTTESTARLAQLLGTDIKSVVKSLSDKSKNLDVYANAAAGLIGGEAEKLVVLAEKAMPRFKDAGTPEYIAFLKQLETVASLQAAFRGSASNMGRGLRSLQTIVKSRQGMAKVARIKSALGKDPADVTAKIGKSFEDKLTALGEAKSPAERERLLRQVLKHRGDLGKVIQQADRFSGITGKLRVFRETSANLFSPGTFVFNVAGGMGMIGSDIIAASTSHLGAWLTKDPEWVAAAAANRAYLGTLLPSLWHGTVRSTQYLAREAVEETKAAVEGLGTTGAGDKLAEVAAWAEKQFGKAPVFEADKLGKGPTLGDLKPKFERADATRERLWHISPTTVDAWNASDNHGAAFMTAGLRSLMGLAFNTFGSVSRLGRVLAIDVPDELIGQTVFDASRYAEAVRLATKQGIDLGKAGRELAEYADRQAQVLVSESSNESLEKLEALVAAGQQDEAKIALLAQEALNRTNVEQIAEADARRVLFQDDLKSAGLRATSSWLNTVDPGGIVVPFVKTPLRIIESAATEFTPAGLFFREFRETIRSGGPEAAEAIARMTLGTMLIVEGYARAASGAVVGYDGGSNSSARNGRPQYSIRLPGGAHWEFGRLDPIAIPLGFGADLYHWEQQFNEDDKEQTKGALERYAYAAMHATVTSVLSKSWLTSLKNFSSMADDKTGDYAREQFFNGLLQRTIPAGGFQKYAVQGDADAILAAKTVAEKYRAGWVGLSSSMPERRDPLLGRVVEFNRTAGFKHGEEEDDPLIKELARLNFERPRDTRSLGGVELSAAQGERLKQLMGEDVKIGGRALSESLAADIRSPTWDHLSDYQRVDHIRRTRARYLDIAKLRLPLEDKQLAGEMRVQAKVKLLQERGVSNEALPAEISRFRKEVLGQ